MANFATTSGGSTPHFTGAMFAREAGIALTPAHSPVVRLPLHGPQSRRGGNPAKSLTE
jgi:hypothetical protein